MTIVQDMDLAIKVMHDVGEWMAKRGMNPSDWWKPENMNRDYLSQHVESNEFYVAVVDNKPASSVVFQETERNQSWKSVDGDHPKKSLYVHWLCVARDFAGRGLSKTMIDFGIEEAQKRGFKLVRLDTEANQAKLCQLYEGLGFKKMGVEESEGHKTAFYEMKL